jgi:hypothetical protein
MESDEMWQRMSMNAIMFAEAHQWETIGERMELLFSTVLDGRRPAARLREISDRISGAFTRN